MHQRRHLAGGLGGGVIAEGANVVAIGKWMQEWTDPLTFDVVPAMSDEDIQTVLGG